MITIKSNEGDEFLFGKYALKIQCKYFERAFSFEKNEMTKKNDVYELDFSSSCIYDFQKFINHTNEKIVCTDELKLLTEYLSCDELKYRFRCTNEIAPIINVIRETNPPSTAYSAIVYTISIINYYELLMKRCLDFEKFKAQMVTLVDFYEMTKIFGENDPIFDIPKSTIEQKYVIAMLFYKSISKKITERECYILIEEYVIEQNITYK